MARWSWVYCITSSRIGWKKRSIEKMKSDEDAEREVAVEHLAAAVEDDQRRRGGGEQLDHRHDGRLQAAGLDVGAHVVFVERGEALGVDVLAREALDDAHAGDVLLQVRVDDGDRLPDAHEGLARVDLPDEGDDDQDRHDAEGDQRQLQVAARDQVDDDGEADDVAEDRSGSRARAAPASTSRRSGRAT